MEVADALAVAERALSEERRADALAHLLAAWRAVRHPRIANVIDFVSEELAAKQPPIKGKTLAARMKVWYQLEQPRDPATLGTLLATPWPGTWQGALAMLQPLLAWPDDPRLAIAFARVVEAYPYDTWTSSRFYVPLIAKLDEQRDLRILPILRRQLSVSRSSYYKRSVLSSLVGSIKKLEQLYPGDEPPALTADVARALATLELRYRDRIATERQQVSSEADLLAAIFADPRDLAARAVYADHLAERGDPRGELVTLQLARADGTASDAALARERKLLEEHARTWAGALDAWLEETPRSFEGGFLAGGSLRWRFQYGSDFSVDRMLRDPSWALIRRLETRGEDELLRELIDRPELRSLREVRVTFPTAAELATGPVREHIEALHWQTGWHAPPPLDPVTRCDSLPKLVEVGFDTNDEAGHAAWIASAPVVERLQRLVVHNHWTAYLEAAARRSGSLREIEIDLQRVDRRDEGWRFLLQRDAAPGPFTRLIARPRGGPHDPARLAPLLNAIPEGWLRELVVTSPRKLLLPKQEHAELVAAIGRFPDARCDLPWADLTPPPVVSVPEGPLLDIRVEGESLFAPDKAAAVWRVVDDELGLQYDSFEIGSKWRQLGEDPVARIQKWAGNARCYDMTLFRDGAPGRLRLARSKFNKAASVTMLEVPVALRSHDDWIDWYLRFLELGTFDSGVVYLAGVERHHRSFDLGMLGCGASAGWLIYFGPVQKPLLPLDRVAALAGRPGLDGVFARASTSGILVGTARTPHDVTAERLAALSAGLREILHASLEQRFGFSLEESVQRSFGELLAIQGMAPVPGKQFELRFASADQERQLLVTLFAPYTKPQIRVQLHAAVADRNWYQDLGPTAPAGTRVELERALADAGALLQKHGGAFFADPEIPRRIR